jgi:hypothetical protein
MVKESIGSADPENLADRDRNGVPDEVEDEFTETSQIQPSAKDATVDEKDGNAGKAPTRPRQTVEDEPAINAATAPIRPRHPARLSPCPSFSTLNTRPTTATPAR